MLQKLLNKYKFKNNGILPMYGPGGFVAKPTASDSLAVMNSALAVQKYYDNLTKKGWYKKPVVSKRASHFDKKLLDEIEKESLKTYKRHLENPAFYKNIYTKNVYPTVTEEDIKKKALQSLSEIKNKKSNTYLYKDLIPIQIDEWAPSTLIDMRIKPQNTVSYSRKTSLEVPGSVVTSIMTYDPIAVKPAAMKTAADWAYMKKTYGTKPPAQQTGTTTKPPAQQKDTANRQVTTTATTKPPARQTINTTQGQVTGTVRPNQIKGSELMMMINPVRSKENLERMEMIPYTLANTKVVPRGELLPIPQMRLPQQGNRPFYGPGNTIVGYTDDNMQFYPAQQYTGAPNNQLNLQDKELLNNPEMLQKYVQSRDNYKFAEGGGIPERYKNMGFTNVGAKKDSTRPGKKWMVLAKKGEDYKVVHGGYQGMQDFKQHHSEQRRENFWNRMGGKDSAKANDPFSPLYWHKRFGTWKYGGQLPKFVGGGGSDHYVNLGPLQNKIAWDTTNPMTTDILNTFQKQGQEIANKSGEVPLAVPVKIGPPEDQEPSSNARPYMEMDPNQNTQEEVTPESIQNVKKPNMKTKTVREPFNQKYMIASNALFTGLDMLGKRNKNSYSNAIKDFNKNQLDYENNNVDLYSTKQDYYGMFSEGGTSTDPKRKLKNFYETMSQDPTYYSDELEVLKDDYNKILQEEEAERNQSLEDYINGRVNSIQPERVIVQDDMTYVPYRAPERRPLFYDQTNGEMPYQPTYAPEMNIGFGASNRYNISKQLEGMKYQMGAKGQNFKIDCSGLVCKIVGAPTMTSEDVTTKGKNFRPYQGEQDLREGTVVGFDFGPKKHDVGRKIGIDHTGVILMNPQTKKLEYRESVSGVGVRTLTIPQFLKKYPNRAKQMFVSDYGR